MRLLEPLPRPHHPHGLAEISERRAAREGRAAIAWVLASYAGGERGRRRRRQRRRRAGAAELGPWNTTLPAPERARRRARFCVDRATRRRGGAGGRPLRSSFDSSIYVIAERGTGVAGRRGEERAAINARAADPVGGGGRHGRGLEYAPPRAEERRYSAEASNRDFLFKSKGWNCWRLIQL